MKYRADRGLHVSLLGASPNMFPRSTIPIGVTPHVLSSSNTSDSTFTCHGGNTGIQRKNVTGYSVIAQATKAFVDAIASQMKDIAEAS